MQSNMHGHGDEMEQIKLYKEDMRKDEDELHAPPPYP
jgi:hypothetical protein